MTTLSEALRNVPGISLQAGEGGGASNTSGDMFNMRGFSANNSLFVDGVRDDGLDLARRLQPRAGRGVPRPDRHRRRPRHRRRLRQHDDQDAGACSRATPARVDDRHRRSAARAASTSTRRRRSASRARGWRGTAVRLNALVQDSGVPGRDDVACGRRPSRRRSRSVSARTPASPPAASSCTRTTCPTTASPARRGPTVRSCPAAASPRSRSTRRTTTARPHVDYDHVSQDSYFARVEHDLTPDGAARGRRSATTRRTATAVISTMQNPAAYNPATELVTIVRQGNERENRITSNQTSVVDGRARPAATVARADRHARVHARRAVRADARRPRHAAAGRHLRTRHRTRP